MCKLNNTQWMVCVRCMTFNQSSFIIDTMNGFTIQETIFPFVCAIIDDASTDGEQDVIRDYLHEHFDLTDKSVARNEETADYTLTFARHKTNKNCYFSVIYLKYNHQSINKDKVFYIAELQENAKYIALCEGDDYWVDAKKLQKQADFLDYHEDVGLVYTNINRYFQIEDRMELDYFSSYRKKIKDTHLDFILNSWFLAPCSWMFRRSFWNMLPVLNPNKYFTGDTRLLLGVSSMSNVVYIDEPMAVYRVLPISASHFVSYSEMLRSRRKNDNTRIYFANRRSLYIRLLLWISLTKQNRPSFKKEIRYIPIWIYGTIGNLGKLLFRLF